MTSELVLGLLRHGQTDWNIDFRLQGVTDIPLNEVGRQQALDAAKHIRPLDWDMLLTSPLSRAFDTAHSVVRVTGFDEQSLLVDERLLERSFGEAEGMLHSEWRERFAGQDAPGSESKVEFRERCQRLLDAFAEEFAGKRILAVSHGALIRELIHIASAGELPRVGERLGNASLNTLAYSNGVWQVRHYEPQTLGGIDPRL